MPSWTYRSIAVVAAASSLCAMACATIWGFDDFSADGNDAGGGPDTGDGPGVGDAGDAGADVNVIDARPCRRDDTFARWEPLQGISDVGWLTVRAPTLTRDERRIYFQGARNQGDIGDVFTATRNDRTKPFTNIQPVTEVNDATKEDFSPTVTEDDKRLVFVRQTTGSTDSDLYFTSRADSNGKFATPQPLNLVNSSRAPDLSPFLTLDGGELWFTTRRVDGGPFTLYRATAQGGGTYRDAEAVPSVDGTDSNKGSPVLSADGTVLFYSAPSADGKTGNVVWEARLDPADGHFKKRRQVLELNTGGLDAPSWLSPDGCRLYYHVGSGGTGVINVGIREP